MTARRKIAPLVALVALALLGAAATSCSGDTNEPAAERPAEAAASPTIDVTNPAPAAGESTTTTTTTAAAANCDGDRCPSFTGQEIIDLHKRPVWSLSQLDDGTIVSSDDETVRLWQIEATGPQFDDSIVIDNPIFGRTTVDLGDGRVGLAVYDGDAIVVADLETQETLQTLQGTDQITRVGGDRLATADTSTGIFVWDLADLSAPVAQLDGVVSNLTSINEMMYFNRNDTVFEWDGVNAPSELVVVEDLWRILATPQHLYVGDELGVITIVDRTTRQEVSRLTGLAEFGVTAIVQLPNGDIAAGGATGDVAIWDLVKPNDPRHIGGFTSYINSMLVTSDGTLLVAMNSDTSESVVAVFAP